MARTMYWADALSASQSSTARLLASRGVGGVGEVPVGREQAAGAFEELREVALRAERCVGAGGLEGGEGDVERDLVHHVEDEARVAHHPPVLGIGRIAARRAPVGLVGLGHAARLVRELADVGENGRALVASLETGLEARDGLDVLPLLLLEDAQALPRRRAARVALGRLAIGALGAGAVAPLLSHEAEQEPGVGPVGGDREGVDQRLGRPFVRAGAIEGDGEVGPGVGVVRREGDRGALKGATTSAAGGDRSAEGCAAQRWTASTVGTPRRRSDPRTASDDAHVARTGSTRRLRCRGSPSVGTATGVAGTAGSEWRLKARASGPGLAFLIWLSARGVDDFPAGQRARDDRVRRARAEACRWSARRKLPMASGNLAAIVAAAFGVGRGEASLGRLRRP